MATPKKTSSAKVKKAKPSNAKKANTAPTSTVKQARQPSGGGKKTLAIVFAVLVGILMVGYFVFGLNPFEAESDTANQDDEKIATTDKEKTTKTDKPAPADKPEVKVIPRQTTSEMVETVASETETDYIYTAGTGESQTTLARLAVAQADSSLTTAERVAAETRLVQATDGEPLDAKDQVQFSKADVQSAVDWAKSLSNDAKAAWQPYADMIAW